MTLQPPNTFVHARCKIVAGNRRRYLSKQLQVSIHVGPDSHRRLDRSGQTFGELRFPSRNPFPGERRSRGNTSPVTPTNRQLQFYREMREVMTQKIARFELNAFAGSVSPRNLHAMLVVRNLRECNAHIRPTATFLPRWISER